MARLRPVLFAILLLLPALSVYSQEQGAPFAQARISEQSRSISIGGRIEPKSRVVHKIDTAGYVEEVAVQVGDFVEVSQKLLSITRKDDVLDLYKPTVLTARITGRVSDIQVQAEDEVKSGDTAVVLIGTDGFLLNTYVSDKDAYRINPGRQITARTAGGSEIAGVLTSRSPEPDYTTGLFQLRFEFPNSRKVHTGEFVLVDLPIDLTRGVFVMRDQIVRRYGKHFIWIVSEEMVLSAREVTTGPAFGDLVLLEEGLEPGETYLIRLTGREKEGDTIEQPAE